MPTARALKGAETALEIAGEQKNFVDMARLALAEELRQKYLRRPAFQDELAKLVRGLSTSGNA